MLLQAAKCVGAGMAIFGLAGAGIGIGFIFGSLINHGHLYWLIRCDISQPIVHTYRSRSETTLNTLKCIR